MACLISYYLLVNNITGEPILRMIIECIIAFCIIPQEVHIFLEKCMISLLIFQCTLDHYFVSLGHIGGEVCPGIHCQ